MRHFQLEEETKMKINRLVDFSSTRQIHTLTEHGSIFKMKTEEGRPSVGTVEEGGLVPHTVHIVQVDIAAS